MSEPTPEEIDEWQERLDVTAKALRRLLDAYDARGRRLTEAERLLRWAHQRLGHLSEPQVRGMSVWLMEASRE